MFRSDNVTTSFPVELSGKAFEFSDYASKVKLWLPNACKKMQVVRH
ncbi:MAG TPA: hypothetical protein VGN10_14735 [Pyrinomonadaceae bacterium]